MVAGLALVAMVIPAPAEAAPPPNDDLQAAQALTGLPVSVSGTTVESTVQLTDPPPQCASMHSGSVWYSLTTRARPRVVLRLQAHGDLDAAIDVVRRQRSQYLTEVCSPTDSRGRATVAFDGRPGTTFLIRVSQRAGSAAGTFALDAVVPEPLPRPPGRALPARGVRGTLDALENTADAYSAHLREGVTYRVNLSHPPTRCVSLAIWGPGNRSFSNDPAISEGCGGYQLLTPGAGRTGRWSFLARASESVTGRQPYRLQIGRTTADDMTPGIPLRSRARGRLQGGQLDAVDIYRLDVEDRAHVVVRMRTDEDNGFNLRLVNARGGSLRCACGERGDVQVRRGLRRGRYYVVVRARHRARGAYTLTRVDRTITATALRINGERFARAPLNSTVRLGVSVRRAEGGRVGVIVERFDPLSGWHFHRRFDLGVRGGKASAAFRPPTEGTWRAKAFYRGTAKASPSESRYARVRVG